MGRLTSYIIGAPGQRFPEILMLCFAQATQKKTLRSLGSVSENGFQAPTARHRCSLQPAPFRPRVIALFDKGASGSYFQVMRSVGLKTLKNKLSEYVRLAAGGETVLVTGRDALLQKLVYPAHPGPRCSRTRFC